MKDTSIVKQQGLARAGIWQRVLVLLSVFGPATITAMADNDASGVATYSIAGATLGYPILFLLLIVTVLLAVTQEMGMRLTVATRRGLADAVRENYGVRASLLIFAALTISNLGTIIVDLAAVKTTSAIFHIPDLPAVILVVLIAFLVITRGSYKQTQNIMLVSCLFFLAYIVSAVKARPDWGLALTNLVYPHGLAFDLTYWKNYLVIGMGVLGTTVTPWGQFFISSFASDKHIERGKILFAQLETYWGAFLTNFFSFFMIVATAATLFVRSIPLNSGDQAALAIEPFAGQLAATLFAVGILNAGFMGLITVSLSTAYSFTEFFGISGSLNDSFKQSKTFYIIFLAQLVIAGLVIFLPGVSLFGIVVATQVLNAVMLPLIFYYLIRLTNDRKMMGEYVNNPFQNWFATISSVVILIAAVFTVLTIFIQI
ncbi:MAG TPA: divalent metal cation transporter [Anaerolineaceae bacterium]